jgi:phosphohistidine phosphatase SixA
MQTRRFTPAAPLIRREALALLAASAWPALSGAADLEGLLRAGGCVLLLRHALTEPGVGDPGDFQLEVCRTQRNLSEEGRAQARRTGAWFSRRALQPRAVLSSAWCRCRDTADLAFGRHQIWTALNSTFGDRLQQSDQTAVLREALARLPQGQFEVWVTHQVNMSALASDYPGMGEGFVLDRQGRLVGRSRFE